MNRGWNVPYGDGERRDSMKPIIYPARSFRGATEGGEPGIYSPRLVVMDSGLAASRRPGMTPMGMNR